MMQMQENKNNENESLAMYLVKEYAKQAKRLFILLIISVIVNLLIVGAFLIFISQYDIENTEIQQDGQGINNYIGGDGDNINGATDSQANANEKER
jgi:hypothetical protein